MASAQVKLTLDPTQFSLLMECLTDQHDELSDEIGDFEHPLTDDQKKLAQKMMALDALIRQLS